MKKRMNRLTVAACTILFFCWNISVRAQVTLEVLNPRGEIPTQAAVGGLSPRIADLSGKKIGLIANYKAGAELFLTKIEEVLKKKVPSATLVRLRMGQGSNIDYQGLASKIDLFIHSTGD